MLTRIGIIIGVIVLLAFVGGGYYYMLQAEKSIIPSVTPTPTSSATLFNSIQDALSKSLSLKCDYTYNTMHTLAYIKNGKIRADVTDAKNASLSATAVIKDKKIYYWNAQKMGFMMAMPQASVTPSSGDSSESGQQTLQNLEKYKQYCKTAAVADDLFDIPADIKFTDTTQMMRLSPTGSAGSYQQQMQQYMQQYHLSPTQ